MHAQNHLSAPISHSIGVTSETNEPHVETLRKEMLFSLAFNVS